MYPNDIPPVNLENAIPREPGIGNAMSGRNFTSPDPGADPSASLQQFLLGIVAGAVLGYFAGRMAPDDWLPAVKVPVGKGGVMESILGGVAMTFTQQPQMTVSETTKEGAPVVIKTFKVYFDTSNSALGTESKQLEIGAGWPSNENWPCKLGVADTAYIANMTYIGEGDTVVRKFSMTLAGTTYEHQFSNGYGTADAEQAFDTKQVGFIRGAQTSTLEIRYGGYLDVVPLKLSAVP